MVNFETVYKKYKPYISQIAINTGNWDNLNSKQDIEQELSIILWKCVNRYHSLPENELEKILKTAFHNRIGSMLKSHRIERQNMVSLDAKNFNKHGKSVFLGDSLSKHMMSDADYKDGINTILDGIEPESAMKLLDVMNFENRGKCVKGTRKVFGEVSNFLYKKD